jgi:hypothetical protein
VCLVFYGMWHKKGSISVDQDRKYSRLDLLSYSSIKTTPSDWRSVEDIKKTLKKYTNPTRSHKPRVKPLAKAVNSICDNKENEMPEKSKQTLGNFILKELENSVSELVKGPNTHPYTIKTKKPGILNPNAQEFIITS